jgi:hypothetical protein
MTALAARSVVRDPEVREGRNLNTGRPSNMEAYLGQLTGSENANPCSHCQKGAGIWVLCVSVGGFFNSSCSNCHYNNEGVRCSFRKLFFGSFLNYLQ